MEATSTQWLHAIVLGAAAGAVGQLVRSIAGIARMNNQSGPRASPQETFQVSTLVVSLIIGATAGAIAALALVESLFPVNDGKVSFQTILGIMAAGYAGADFVEGIAGKYFPAEGTGQAAQWVAMKEEIRLLAGEAGRAGAASAAGTSGDAAVG